MTEQKTDDYIKNTNSYFQGVLEKVHKFNEKNAEDVKNFNNRLDSILIAISSTSILSIFVVINRLEDLNLEVITYLKCASYSASLILLLYVIMFFIKAFKLKKYMKEISERQEALNKVIKEQDYTKAYNQKNDLNTYMFEKFTKVNKVWVSFQTFMYTAIYVLFTSLIILFQLSIVGS